MKQPYELREEAYNCKDEVVYATSNRISFLFTYVEYALQHKDV